MFMWIYFVPFFICAKSVYGVKIEDDSNHGVRRYPPKFGDHNKKLFTNRRYKYTMPQIYSQNIENGLKPATHKVHHDISHQENEILVHPYPQYPHLYKQPVEHQYGHQPIQSTKQAVMEALFLLAKNDDLQCVPKILCDMTSGMASGRQSTLNLPININLESFLSFLSSLKGVGSSPLIYFSAALLGYTSKGNSGQCSRTFPNCPSDPDKLVQYLNQHNGGFFRFFNGVNPSIELKNQNFRRAKETSYSYAPFHKKYLKTTTAEERIQTRPTMYIPSTSKFKDEENVVFDFEDSRKDGYLKGLRFPPEVNYFQFSEPTEPLRFPQDNEDPYRRPKELQYDFLYNQNSLELQRPLPNHIPATMIFPVRTGTGELKLDPDELNVQNEPIYFDQHRDNMKIKFQSEQETRPGNEENGNYRDGFTFPS